MRKSLWMLAALGLCALVVVMAAIGALQGSREDIAVMETTVSGDPAAAEDLQVRTVLNLKNHLFWQTDYAAGVQPEANTVFRLYQRRQQYPYEQSPGEISIGLPSKNFGISGHVNLDEHPDLMTVPVMDVASRTPAGESRTEVVQLCQYYDVYPLYAVFPGQLMDRTMEEPSDAPSFLTSYFQVPVPETDYMEVTVEKDTGGNVVDVRCSDWIAETASDQEQENVPYLYSDSAIVGDYGYFVLCGNVDLSQSRGGYGLYRIPITWVDNWNTLQFSEPEPLLELEQLENVYPMDPAFCEEVRLKPGTDETELLLFTQSESGAVLTVLDTTDCTVKQQVELEQQTLPTVWQHENLLILYHENYETDSRWLQVLQNRNGQYAFWLQTAEFPLLQYGGRSDPVFCFDGERLGVANYLEFYEDAAHRIMVYDRTGLLYAGDYAYSSDTMPEAPSVLNWDETLQIRWETQK